MLIKIVFFFGGGRGRGVCYIYWDCVYFCLYVSYIWFVNIVIVYFVYRKKILFNKWYGFLKSSNICMYYKYV